MSGREPYLYSDLERKVIIDSEGRATPESLNILRAGMSAYVHGNTEGLTSKEEFMKSVEFMYDEGVKRKENPSYDDLEFNSVNIPQSFLKAEISSTEAYYNAGLDGRSVNTFGDKATLEFVNDLRAGMSAYVHGNLGFIAKEKFLEWVDFMYNQGVKRIAASPHDITIDFSDPITVSALLLEFGVFKGYLSPSNHSRRLEQIERDHYG